MKKVLFIILFLSAILSFGVANAIEAPANLKLESSTMNSLEISWDTVQDAAWYYVYYGTQSGTWGYWYESILEELVEDTRADILDLNEETTYYVAVIAIDSNYKESSYSQEWVFSTSWAEKDNKFALQKVNVLSANKLELIFNNNLDSTNWVEGEFKIVNKNDNLDEPKVVESVLLENKNKLELVLDKDMIKSWKYNITVISLTDSNWDNIESWVDWINSFVTPVNFPFEETLEEVIESGTEWSELESAWADLISEPVEKSNEIDNKSENDNKKVSLSWKEIPKEEVIKNMEMVSKNTEKLPQAWPEHWVLLIISLILWFVFFKMKFKTN